MNFIKDEFNFGRIFIIAVSYFIKKIYFPEKKQERVFEGECEEIDDKES